MADAAPVSSSPAPSSTPSTTPSPGGSSTPTQTSAPKTQATGSSGSPSTGVPSGQTSSSPSSSPEMREFKIDGKLVRMTQKEADDYVSMSYAAQERFKEAARIRKEMEAREQTYSKNPVQAFLDYAQKAKLNPEQVRNAIEEYYTKQWIEPETLSPEQRELRSLQEYKRQTEAEQIKRMNEEREVYERKMTDDQVQNVTQEIISALDTAQLPKGNKFLVQRMAFYMHQNSTHGWNAPPELVLKQVVNEHKGIVGDFLKDCSMEQLVSYAGQDFIDRVLKFSLEKLRDNRKQLQEPFSGGLRGQGHGVPQPEGKIDMSEVNRRLRDMRSGKFISSG